MTWCSAWRSNHTLIRRIDRWLVVMALSLEGLAWPTAAELWLAELSDRPEPPPSEAAAATDTDPEGESK